MSDDTDNVAGYRIVRAEIASLREAVAEMRVEMKRVTDGLHDIRLENVRRENHSQQIAELKAAVMAQDKELDDLKAWRMRILGGVSVISALGVGGSFLVRLVGG